MKHTHTALITWASRGIGKSLAHLHAQDGHNLVLVARSQDDLDVLKQDLIKEYHIIVHTMSIDLSKPDSASWVYEYCKKHDIKIDYLINNAGFGGYGELWKQDWIKHQSMIDLNITTLTHLTYLFLPEMIARKSGKILQVASTAGMIPGPMQAVYHATKAYVLSLSQAVSKELEWTGVTITALCPGPVDTWFAKVANVVDSKAFQYAADVDEVAREGYRAMMRGDLVIISGLPRHYRFLMSLLPLLPRSFVLSQAKQAIQKVKK